LLACWREREHGDSRWLGLAGESEATRRAWEKNSKIGEGKVKYTPAVLMIEVAHLLLPHLPLLSGVPTMTPV
jgi:hypothetical protein